MGIFCFTGKDPGSLGDFRSRILEDMRLRTFSFCLSARSEGAEAISDDTATAPTRGQALFSFFPSSFSLSCFLFQQPRERGSRSRTGEGTAPGPAVTAEVPAGRDVAIHAVKVPARGRPRLHCWNKARLGFCVSWRGGDETLAAMRLLVTFVS